ncbi:hypothetical protein R3P38DRAFT_3216053 [Favolaschia claudopus]|uniref:Uncharacterized protein n=1 Tax=Favolaschia claudopus TaxID=2862362 RepID=A0AAW0A7Z5_9AGAR
MFVAQYMTRPSRTTLPRRTTPGCLSHSLAAKVADDIAAVHSLKPRLQHASNHGVLDIANFPPSDEEEEVVTNMSDKRTLVAILMPSFSPRAATNAFPGSLTFVVAVLAQEGLDLAGGFSLYITGVQPTIYTPNQSSAVSASLTAQGSTNALPLHHRQGLRVFNASFRPQIALIPDRLVLTPTPGSDSTRANPSVVRAAVSSYPLFLPFAPWWRGEGQREAGRERVAT